jgi:hypothetical protein
MLYEVISALYLINPIRITKIAAFQIVILITFISYHVRPWRTAVYSIAVVVVVTTILIFYYSHLHSPMVHPILTDGAVQQIDHWKAKKKNPLKKTWRLKRCEILRIHNVYRIGLQKRSWRLSALRTAAVYSPETFLSFFFFWYSFLLKAE